MLGKLQENERDLFRTRLEDLINPRHELALLAKAIVGIFREGIYAVLL